MMTFVLQRFEKILHNLEYLGLGRNLEIVIIGICLVHRNSPKQPRIQTKTKQRVMCTRLRTKTEYVLQRFENLRNLEYHGIGWNLETVITGICPVHWNSPEQLGIQTKTEQRVMCTGLRTKMEYSDRNGTEFKTLLRSVAPYRSKMRKMHYVKINIVNFKNQTI